MMIDLSLIVPAVITWEETDLRQRLQKALKARCDSFSDAWQLLMETQRAQLGEEAYGATRRASPTGRRHGGHGPVARNAEHRQCDADSASKPVPSSRDSHPMPSVPRVRGMFGWFFGGHAKLELPDRMR